MARGSNAEVETQLFIARELGYGNPETIEQAAGLADEVGRMLNGLLKRL